MSLYLWQHLFVRIGCSIALEAIREVVPKSAASLSRLRIVISVDDTFVFRYGEGLAYTSDWWSSQAKQPMKGQNILGIVLKIGKQIVPLNMRLISKQGRGNTDKPSCVITMFKEVVSFFEGTGIDIRNYPVTLQCSYSGNHSVLVKSCAYMVSTPRYRTVLAEYACGILHDLKTDLNLTSMSLKGQNGAYANLGVKVMSYLLGQHVSRSVRKTFHQTQLELTGQRQMLSTLSEHFHEQIPRKH